MNSAPIEIDEVHPGLVVWQRYDPTVKAELFSTAVASAAGMYLVDPIGPVGEVLGQLPHGTRAAGVIVTNVNHARAAAEFAEHLSVPLFATDPARDEIDSPAIAQLVAGPDSPPGLSTIGIEGAPAGEIAIHCASDGGTLIVGDALINFGSHGFSFLPAKYCLDHRLMRKSLRKLLDYAFNRMLFAHGTPVLSGARERLRRLLDVEE